MENASDKLVAQVILNYLAQKLISPEVGLQWFSAQTSDRRWEIISELCHLIAQCHTLGTEEKDESFPSLFEINHSQAAQDLRNKGRYGQIPHLPEVDSAAVFAVAVETFSEADRRRREEICRGQCQHWWHSNIRSSKYLELAKQSIGNFAMYGNEDARQAGHHG